MTELPAPTLQRVRLADVQIAQRLRPVSEAGVEAILASVEEIGRIKDPIHLRKSKKGLTLLAGGHRYEAYRRLSTDEIDAWVWSGITDDHARLIEIDDNLAGAEMGALDTAVFLAERKRVYEKLHPEARAKTGAALVASRWNTADIVSVVSFAKVTAEKFGMTERHVRRLVEAGQKLGADSARLRHCPRPVTLKDLIEIAKVGEPTERYAIVDALREGKAKTAAEARRAWLAKEKGENTSAKDPVEEAFNTLSKAWDRASMAAKRRFVSEYLEPLHGMCLEDIQNGEEAYEAEQLAAGEEASA
jgi:ParB family chromosome partitioning protein